MSISLILKVQQIRRVDPCTNFRLYMSTARLIGSYLSLSLVNKNILTANPTIETAIVR